MKKILLLVLLIACTKIIKLDNKNKDVNEKLLLAIKENDEVKVKKLISKGADINYTSNGKTLLDIAIDKANANVNVNVKILYLLLKNDINVDNQDRIIKIYDLALNDFNYKIIDMMVKKDYRIKEGMINNNKYFLLLCYISNAEEVENFIKNNNIKLQEIKDKSSENGLTIALRRGNLEVVKLLLNYEIEANSKNIFNCTALMLAAQNGHIEIVKLLIEKGANVNDKDNNGWTVLMLASKIGHKKIAEMLIEKGANLDITSYKYNLTALMLALSNDHTEIAKLLIEKGADISRIAYKGSSALNLAIEGGYKEILELLLDKGADICIKDGKIGSNALMIASQKGHKDLVEILLEKGADIYDVNDEGFTALMLAIEHNHKEIVELLLEKRNHVEDTANDSYELSPLMLASKYGHEEIIELLLKRGEDINNKNYSNQSALTLALKYENVGAVKLLLSRGALIFDNLKELKILIEALIRGKKGKLIKEEIQKNILNELLFHDGKLNIKSLLLIYKGALNSGRESKEILTKNIIENINIADIYFLDSFTFSAKSLLIDCFLYLSDTVKLVKVNDVSELKKSIIKTFVEYYEKKDNNVEAAETKFSDNNSSIKIKIADFIIKISNILGNLNNKEFTTEDLIEELNKQNK